jgi:hypothetical protein
MKSLGACGGNEVASESSGGGPLGVDSCLWGKGKVVECNKVGLLIWRLLAKKELKRD